MRGDREVFIFGERYDVKAEVRSIKSMSAHGDYEDLLRFISCQEPEKIKKIFLVHGEYDVQINFSKTLKEKGFLNVEIPSQHEKIALD